MNKIKKYGKVSWCWEDIKTLKTEWTREKCEQFLEEHDAKLSQTQVEQGWHFIELALTGYE
jgi:hypothetical protein